jgi:hypothetical protein
MALKMRIVENKTKEVLVYIPKAYENRIVSEWVTLPVTTGAYYFRTIAEAMRAMRRDQRAQRKRALRYLRLDQKDVQRWEKLLSKKPKLKVAA